MLIVQATKIEEWANTNAAFGDLPHWIALLIRATCDDVTTLDMPGGEHVRLGGFDGVVRSGRGNEFVPEGLSGWELSVDRKVLEKANDDLNKRDANPLSLAKSETTFVFATPRRFPSASRWQSDNVGRGWREIKPLWSSHLERWFAQAPWLATAFLKQRGLAPPGLKSFGMLWDDYCVTQPPDSLNADFVIANRRETVEELLNWFSDSSGKAGAILRFTASSEKEALHFLIACLQSAAIAKSPELQSRLFAVSTEEAASSLGRLNSSHIIVATADTVTSVLQTRIRTECRVIVIDSTPAHEIQPLPRIPSIRLPVARGTVWAPGLIKQGFSGKDASALCEKFGSDYETLRFKAFKC